jgi:sialic acid synthase SpsE
MLLVAEIGLNHNGDWEKAREMIRKAKWAGADVAKFQFGWKSGPNEINAMDFGRTARLKEWCAEAGIELMASLFTEEALEWARELDLPRYKVASRTVVDRPELCRRILADGKPTFVSLGMWNEPEFPFGPPDGKTLFYIYCRSKYPAFGSDLTGFPERFEESAYYGYSDHCLDLSACFLAIDRGARYLEKHFTMDKSSTVIRDHALSATPEEFRRLSDRVREVVRQ